MERGWLKLFTLPEPSSGKKTIASLVIIGSLLLIAIGFISYIIQTAIINTSSAVSGFYHIYNPNATSTYIYVDTGNQSTITLTFYQPSEPTYSYFFSLILTVFGFLANIILNKIVLIVIIVMDLIALAVIISE